MIHQLLRAVLRRAGIPLLAAVAAACSTPPADAPVVRIGVLASLTGPRVVMSGASTRDGAMLAAREINEAGGIDVGGVRHRMEVVLTDIGEGTDMATSAAQSLLTRPDIQAIVGPQYSRNALPVAVLAERVGVPMITPMASHPDVTAGRRWVYRIAFTDDVQATALARWAREGLHARRAAVLYEESASYSRGLTERFAAAFTQGGGQVVAREGYTRDRASDFSAALGRLAAAKPDVLLLPNELPDDTLQIRQAAAAGLRAPLLLADFVDPNVMSGLPMPGGLFTTHHWYLEGSAPANRAFVAAFSKVYGHAPNATSAATYDAVRLIADAMHRAGRTTPAALRDAIAATREFHGATGTMDFTARQDPAKRAVVMRLDGGRLVAVREMAP
ncbi:MAG: ethanolamine utilization protein EutJ [Gemmatimonadetes bacterium]|jgi:branched-chain amino acid transport system substrate-binding protein|nr:ethanolamine utilization protein EutJ [Gemmatimonadota bacterium]